MPLCAFEDLPSRRVSLTPLPPLQPSHAAPAALAPCPPLCTLAPTGATTCTLLSRPYLISDTACRPSSPPPRSIKFDDYYQGNCFWCDSSCIVNSVNSATGFVSGQKQSVLQPAKPAQTMTPVSEPVFWEDGGRREMGTAIGCMAGPGSPCAMQGQL